MTDKKEEESYEIKSKFLINLAKYIKEGITEAKQTPIQTLKEFLIEVIKYFIITIIILYFISRPYRCTTETGNELQLEEVKFHYNEIKTCKYYIAEDFSNIIYAIKNKNIEIQQEGGIKQWNITQTNLNPTN